MVRSWCMRYEAKHRYFKQLAGILGNFTNVAYSLAARHQRLQCLKVNSSGNFCSEFLQKPIEIGKVAITILKFLVSVLTVPLHNSVIMGLQYEPNARVTFAGV